jgi:hypothetical protein
MAEANNNGRLFGFSEALFIAMLTAFGYGAAFTFQLGFCAYFDISAEFIRIGLDVITGVIGLFTFLFVSVKALNAILIFFTKSTLERSPRSIMVVLLLMTFAVIWLAFGDRILLWKMLAPIVWILLFVTLASTLIILVLYILVRYFHVTINERFRSHLVNSLDSAQVL